jgi:hypothetical protein
MSYYPPNLFRMQWSFTFALEDMVSPRCLGCLPPRRASAPARHLIGTCLAPTWHLLGICFGAPLARCHLALPVYPSCLHALVLVRLLGAPPTGGTHSLSESSKQRLVHSSLLGLACVVGCTPRCSASRDNIAGFRWRLLHDGVVRCASIHPIYIRVSPSGKDAINSALVRAASIKRKRL